jgi:transcriptional regulator with XRE-family HTH domain
MELQEIKDLLSDRNLTEVSRRTNVSYSTLRNILSGRSVDPSYSTIDKLRKYLMSTCPRCVNG